MSRTYYLVLYEEGKSKGANNAMPTILDEESAKVIMQVANPTIERKKEGKKFQVTSKRFFEYNNLDGSKTLFIVCDCVKVKE